MADARNFCRADLRRTDLLFANRETAEVTGVPYLTDGPDDVAKTIQTS